MDRHLFGQAQVPPRLLLKRARRICHVQSTTAITDRKSVLQYVLAKFHSHLGIKRLHESVAKDIAGNGVRMTRAKNQIAIGVDSGPVEGHEATFVAKGIQVIS